MMGLLGALLIADRPAVVVLAGEAGSLDLGTGLLTYGPLGIMVAGFMFGYIIPGPTHKRVVEENDRLRALIDEKVWPTINDATAAMKESTDTVREVVRLLPPPVDSRREL